MVITYSSDSSEFPFFTNRETTLRWRKGGITLTRDGLLDLL